MPPSARYAWAGPAGPAQARSPENDAPATDRGRGVATAEELHRLIADRANDPQVPDLTPPAPGWADTPEDPKRRHIRMRERRIRHLERRLHGASRTMDRAVDQEQ